MPRLVLLLWPAGVALGVAAEATAFGWDDPGHWIPDLVVGWSLLGCGLAAWSRRPDSWSGALLAMTGATWFFGNFDSSLLYVHRGLLIHCILSFPSGRLGGRLERAAVVAGYAVSAIWPLGESEAATVAEAWALIAVAGIGYARAVGPERRARVGALRAAVAVGVALTLTAVAHFVFPAGDADELALLGYEAVLCGVAAGFLIGLLRAPSEQRVVTDLVVELGDTRSTTIRANLARALGDPSLEIGYWVADLGAYCDSEGRAVTLPGPGSSRAITRLDQDGAPLAVLVHDPAVLNDPALISSVTAAARLEASRARLQAEVRAQLAELESSRARLLAAGDEQRRELATRLRGGAERRLLELAEELGEVSSSVVSDPTALQHVARAQARLSLAIEELAELSRGLHPRLLAEAGLSTALAEVAQRSPVPVELTGAPPSRLPRDSEAAVYFVCSEALANVSKHASASRVTIAVEADNGWITITISDDGVGGAILNRGRGLRGLTDRVHALGGELRLHSPTGKGTRLSVTLPTG